MGLSTGRAVWACSHDGASVVRPRRTITTAIATVHRERLIYRGVDAVEFAGTASLEDAATAQKVLLLGDDSYFETDEARQIESFLGGRNIVCERVAVDDVGKLVE